LDHFHECDGEAKSYTECVVKHELMPKRCRSFQVAYLQCRMNAGLMDREEMEKLGINDQVSYIYI
jgi:cytochrome c oxidase assembly protein subunit 19